MSDKVLRQIESIIQRDVNHRGLATDPLDNLLTTCRGDFVEACKQISNTKKLRGIGIVTGFYIPSTGAAETDGPLGTVFLARILARLGHAVFLMTEDFCLSALEAALARANENFSTLSRREEFLGLVVKSYTTKSGVIALVCLRAADESWISRMGEMCDQLIAIERVGPSHSLSTFQSQSTQTSASMGKFLAQSPRSDWNHYHTMRGHIITEKMFPAHLLFEPRKRSFFTIGIGDGGNEIGMGKIPWETIAKNIPNGGLVACRVPTDYNIVCGVSNWGAYGLAAGVWHLRGMPFDEELFSADRERELWEKVLKEAVLVDGVTGQRTLTVDGLSWDDYIQPLCEIAAILKESS
jgi:D-glutamate cyclase